MAIKERLVQITGLVAVLGFVSLCEAQEEDYHNRTFMIGVLHDKLLSSDVVTEAIEQWNSDINRSIHLQHNTLSITEGLTFMETLQFVTRVSCNQGVGLVMASLCDPRMIQTLPLSRIPSLILNQDPTCITWDRGAHDVMISPVYWSIGDVITRLVGSQFSEVTFIRDKTADLHIAAVRSSLERNFPHSSVISDISVQNDSWTWVIDDLNMTNPEIAANKPDRCYVIWTDTNLAVDIMKEIRALPPKQRYQSWYWLIICQNEECLLEIESNFDELFLDNMAVLVIQNNRGAHRNLSDTQGKIKNVIEMIGGALEDALSLTEEKSLVTIDNSCIRVQDTFLTNNLMPRVSAVLADDSCAHYDVYLGNNDLGDPGFTRLPFCNNTYLDIFPKPGLNGKHLKVTTIGSAPFVVVEHTSGGDNQFGGIAIEMLIELANRFNFTYDLNIVPDSQFGTLKDDGNWTGMVGQLQRKEVDISVASLSVTDARKTVADFVDYYFEYGSAIMKKPDDDENKWRVILQPFRWHVWLCLVFSVPFAGLIAWIISLIVYSFISGDRDDFINPTNSTWYTFGALLTQGGIDLPRSSSGRTFICSWWFFSIIVVATYGGSLIAYLTIAKIDVPFYDLAGMVKQDRYKWGFSEGTVYYSTFKNATGGVFKELWNGAQQFAPEDPSVLSKSKPEQLEKVGKGNYVYIMDRTPLLVRAISDESCDLVMLSETFMPLPFGIGLQKGSPYKKYLEEGVKEIRQSGLIRYWEKRWWPKQSCSGIPIPEAHKITLMDTQSAFYLLLAGVVAAAVVLLGEGARRQTAKSNSKVHSGSRQDHQDNQDPGVSHIPSNQNLSNIVPQVENSVTYIGNGHVISEHTM